MKGGLNLLSLGACIIALAQAQHGEDYSKTMGPVAFMWPPDRVWGAAQDNTAPCGSVAGVTNRTQFPLLNGQVALVAQDESWSVQVAISYSNNPTSNDDFQTIIAPMRIPELDEGHQCFPIVNPPADVETGSNATLQIKYVSDFDTDKNETFYACSDITYIPTSQFTYQVPCFNATIEDFNITEPSSSASGTAAGASATAPAPSQSSRSSSSGLSGGAIAGIVVGVVAGVGSIAGILLFFFWRRSARNKRLREHEASVRAVKWDEQLAGSPPTSRASTQDIALSNMPGNRA
ncbi:hypothetical protein H2204_004247 [Knufia peltigerae]|uniref:Copper acquisition factor BIM1-like domain-containing protein n=1 Tax=Knufia peltigerae TaxID=1002370 RepID=A0AA39CYP0_9EURO|nr:hypothetical protein H2204_004247 [Knufia peltigerae]